jgi:hypothetical protein
VVFMGDGFDEMRVNQKPRTRSLASLGIAVFPEGETRSFAAAVRLLGYGCERGFMAQWNAGISVGHKTLLAGCTHRHADVNDGELTGGRTGGGRTLRHA